MTKAKALKILIENGLVKDSEKTIVDNLARKIAQAFGYTLSDLNLRRFRLCSYHLEKCVGRKKETHGVYLADLIKEISIKQGTEIPVPGVPIEHQKYFF